MTPQSNTHRVLNLLLWFSTPNSFFLIILFFSRIREIENVHSLLWWHGRLKVFKSGKLEVRELISSLGTKQIFKFVRLGDESCIINLVLKIKYEKLYPLSILFSKKRCL